VDAEAVILSGIGFELPLDHTYSALVREFYDQKGQPSHDTELATKCLAFYQEGIQLSGEFVLSSDLGLQIINYLKKKFSKDVRIRAVCKIIKRKRATKALAYAQQA
jgi:hypothetical protein